MKKPQIYGYYNPVESTRKGEKERRKSLNCHVVTHKKNRGGGDEEATQEGEQSDEWISMGICLDGGTFV